MSQERKKDLLARVHSMMNWLNTRKGLLSAEPLLTKTQVQ